MREPTSTEKAHPAAPQGKPCTKDAAGEASGDGTSRDLSLLVARTLRIGVALAGLIALVGGNAARPLSFFLQCFAGKCGSLYDAWRHLRQRRANEPHRVDTARRLGFDPYAFLARRHFFF